MTHAIALIPGAGGDGWFWHLVEADLRGRGFDAFAIDLPAADESSGLAAYADAVVQAIGNRTDVTLVAQSLGGFTAPLVGPRVDTRLVVLVNAMIPLPGESAAAWGDHVGSSEARIAAAAAGGYPREFDDETYFFHDVPADLVASMTAHETPEAGTAFEDPCTFDGWPAGVPIRVISGRDDRLLPLALQRRVARDRLGVDPVVVPGGHLAALSHPVELSDAIAGCVGAP